MTDDALVKIIQKAVKDEVRPLKEQVEIVKSKVDKLDLFQSVGTENIRSIKEQQSVMNEKLDSLEEVKVTIIELKEIVEDRIYPSVVEIEKDIKAYGDMYKINDDNARKLEKRVVTLEDHARIQSPPELSLAEVTRLSL